MRIESKIGILRFFYFLGLITIFLRVFYWQVVQGERLAIAADKQHFSVVELTPHRGEIRSRDGYSLVGNKNLYWLYANLRELNQGSEEITKKITPLVLESNPKIATDSGGIDKLGDQIKSRLELKDVVWVKLFPGITDEVKHKIEGLNLSGLSFQPQAVRDYPEASMAAHILGFVGETDDGKMEGRFGVEGFYDKELSGRQGRTREERDTFLRPILIGSILSDLGVDGSDIELTIDRGVQSFVDKHLAEGIETWGAAGGSAVVLDPKNGDILASSNYPKFDPSNFTLYPVSSYKDPLISDLYEPGSIMKPLVMAAALNEGALKPSSKCPSCSGPVTIGEYTIHTFNNQYHPNLDMTDVLINSDNTGMVYVGKSLGFEKLYKYLELYELSEATGVDLQGEQSSSLRPIGSWYPIDQATVTFGQGIAVTPLQMARAFSILANGGELVTPRIVRAISFQGERKELAVKKPQKIVSTETTRLLTDMLVRVSKESPLQFPLNRIKSLANFKIAAKSGTAQIPIAGHYEKDRTIASVIGYAPAGSPKFVVLVKLDSPTVRPWGSDTAGPIFFKIIDDLIKYYGINP